MTKRIEDLVQSFTDMSFDDQLERIRKVRNARTIERPVAAVKRVKKEAKARDKNVDKTRTAILKLTPEMRALLIAKLQGKTT